MPSVARLDSTDTNGDRISENTIGDSHHRKRRSSHAMPPAHTRPSNICEPWRRNASPQGVSSSSRCGEFHTTSQPRKALTTNTVWNNMRTGASSTENSISISIEMNRRNAPPYSFAPLAQISTMLSSFGRNNSTSVVENSAIASSAATAARPGTAAAAAGSIAVPSGCAPPATRWRAPGT